MQNNLIQIFFALFLTLDAGYLYASDIWADFAQGFSIEERSDFNQGAYFIYEVSAPKSGTFLNTAKENIIKTDIDAVNNSCELVANECKRCPEQRAVGIKATREEPLIERYCSKKPRLNDPVKLGLWRAPVYAALVSCVSTGSGAIVENIFLGEVRVISFDKLLECINQRVIKANPTKNRVNRIKTLRGWFLDVPPASKRGSFIITAMDPAYFCENLLAFRK
jgi:hypothetical protein